MLYPDLERSFRLFLSYSRDARIGLTREGNEGVASSQRIGSLRDAAAAQIVDLGIPRPRSCAPGPHTRVFWVWLLVTGTGVRLRSAGLCPLFHCHDSAMTGEGVTTSQPHNLN